MKWASERKNWTQSEWNKIIFSDESRFTVSVGHEKGTVIRKKCEAFFPECLKRTVKFPSSIMVWGCMSSKGVGKLCFINGTVNAVKYQEILEKELIPSVQTMYPNEEYLFQQDGASCHTAKSTSVWFQNHEMEVLPWPSSSPDLSPIETLWGIIKKKLKNVRPATIGPQFRKFGIQLLLKSAKDSLIL